MNKLFLSFLIIISFGYSSYSQEGSPSSTKIKSGYYLVVAAYSKSNKELADRYANSISTPDQKAYVAFFPKKNFYFVYLKYYNDFNESIRGLFQYRKNTVYKDCWVYIMTQSEIIDKARDKQISSISSMFADRFASLDKSKDSLKNEQNAIKEEVEKVEKKAEKTIDAGEKTDNLVDGNISKILYLSLYDARTQIETVGGIDVIDAVNLEKIGVIDGNVITPLEDPKNGTGNLLLISNAFGFKRKQLDFNFYKPFEDDFDYITNIGDTIVVNFELQRYSKGDFMIMHNVYFYKDAAIMKPESQYELHQLLELMRSNTGLKIRIHGHTNGNAPGLIKMFDSESKNYFSLEATLKETTGSAKKLSGLRADIIQQYLVDNGIEASRMDTKAWGGKAMIHDKHDTQAKQNVRVEIEFLTD